MTLRPAVEPPNRTFVIGAMVGGSALVASIAVALISRMPDDVPPPAPIARVTVTPSAPVVVPVPVTITPPAPPPPPPPPAPPEPPPIRATSPQLIAECVTYSEAALACAWDRGFPAISADGQTIVREHHPDDGGRGNPNLSIQFVDVATSKVTREVVIFTSDEYEPEKMDILQPKITRRVKAAQKLIDAQEFRSMIALSRVDSPGPHVTQLRVEDGEGRMRIVDTEARTEIYRADYTVYSQPRNDAECGGYDPSGTIPVWWDAETRTIIADVYFAYGGCLCSGETRAFTQRIK